MVSGSAYTNNCTFSSTQPVCLWLVHLIHLHLRKLLICMRRKWQPTPVFLPREFSGQRSLVGCCPWGHTESDMTEATQHACMHWRRKWEPTTVFLSGESQGRRSLVGCRLCGRTESRLKPLSSSSGSKILLPFSELFWVYFLQIFSFSFPAQRSSFSICCTAGLLSHVSRVQLCATPQTAAHQASPSLGFSRQEHWSGLPFPSPMHESEK